MFRTRAANSIRISDNATQYYHCAINFKNASLYSTFVQKLLLYKFI